MCLVYFYCCNKMLTTKNLWNKGYISHCILQFIVDRSHERNLRRILEIRLQQSHEGTLLTDLNSMACSSYFHLQPSTTCPGMASSVVALTLPHQLPDVNFLIPHTFAHTWTHMPVYACAHHTGRNRRTQISCIFK